jgi:glyoxylase-like metal-dependent hydrolase (beta-lactamase superfamily II)
MDEITQLEDNLFAIDSTFKFVEGIFVRSYLVIGDAGVALIDAGILGTEKQVLKLIEDLGIEKSRLRVVLVTHAHADHAGSVRELKDETGCLVAVQGSGAELIRDRELMFQDFMLAFPAQMQINDLMRERWFAIAGEPANPDIQFYGDGFRIDLGGVILDAKETPGHSKDSICVYEPNRHWLFTGDSICGRGPFDEPPCYRDATVYRDSLLRMKKLKVDWLFAGHFPKMNHEEAAYFVDESLDVVEKIDRIVREMAVNAGGSFTLEEVGRGIAETMGYEYMIQALFTANAHLIELERLGVVAKFGTEEASYCYIPR